LGSSSYGPLCDFNGQIDEVGIWTRALSAQEVSDIYNNGSGITYPFINPATIPLYYNNAENDKDWGNLLNWWQDSGFSIQATDLPVSTNPVHIYADVLENTYGDGVCYCAAAEFHSASFYYPLVLNTGGGLVNLSGNGGVFDGTCTDGVSVHDTCSLGENAVIQGNATFRDSSTTIGTVNGNAYFYESSYNYGHILGNAEVNYSGGAGNYPIGGIVDGSVTYLGWPAAQDQYFNDQASGAGASGNWQDLANWWADDSFTTRPINSVGTQELPDVGTNIYVYGNGFQTSNGTSTINVNRARFYNGAYLNPPIVLNVSINVYFYNSSGNQGLIYGDTYFYDNSYFWTNYGDGFIHGNVYLYHNSGIYEEARTGENIASGGLYFNSLNSMKNTIGYHFGGESDGVAFNLPPSGGGKAGFISRLLNFPWFINI
jgi:hypothetical protein